MVCDTSLTEASSLHCEVPAFLGWTAANRYQAAAAAAPALICTPYTRALRGTASLFDDTVCTFIADSICHYEKECGREWGDVSGIEMKASLAQESVPVITFTAVCRLPSRALY